MHNEMSIQNRLHNGAIATIGIPWDENSSFLNGAALAPEEIRRVLYDGASNLYSETEVNLENHPDLIDLGDLELNHGLKAIEQIRTAVDGCLEHGARVIALGGDHAITYPIILAYAQKYPNLTILQIDAHPDLYDEFDGNRLSHASPFARIMETQKVGRLVQVGIRSLNQHLRQQADRFQVEMYLMQNGLPELSFPTDVPLYLSLDLDALDPAFAPGVSHHEPGGLTTREVIKLIQAIRAPLVGGDIVELNPTRDLNLVTARLAAKLLKEISAKMLEFHQEDHK